MKKNIKKRLEIILTIFISIICISSLRTAKAASPIGILDYVRDGYAYGWAYDPDTPSSSLDIHFYYTLTDGSGTTFLGNIATDINRPDVNSSLNITGNHGFKFKIPDSVKDNKARKLIAYAIDSQNVAGSTSMLAKSPMYFIGDFSYFLISDAKIQLTEQGENVFDKIGFAYTYAPAIIKDNGVYHAFFCSPGTIGISWDSIRHVKSTDGVNWTNPEIKVRSNPANHKNYAACDPSVIYYHGYYYLYYTTAYANSIDPNGNPLDYEGAIQVARSQTIDGQYLTLTDRNTWEDNPTDTKIIAYGKVRKSNSDCNSTSAPPICKTGYGAGQQTVIVKDNKIYMWYLDDSNTQDLPNTQLYMMESTNPIQWDYLNSKKLNISQSPQKASIDIKYDSKLNKYIMYNGNLQHSVDTSSQILYSSDGINWSDSIEITNSNSFPNFANNPGMLSDNEGHLIDSEEEILAFAAPYNLNDTDDWGKWNLYGYRYDVSGKVAEIVSPPPPPTTITSTPTPNCSKKSQGDANCDLIFDLLDFSEFLEEFRYLKAPHPTLPPNDPVIDPVMDTDFNNSGTVDLLDFQIWVNSFRNTH